MFTNRMSTEQNFTCGEFARRLLDEAGLSYQVAHNRNSLAGRCDFRRKLITLGFPLESDTLQSLFQAAHEVGHAVQGPTVFMSHPALTALLYLSIVLGCFFAGSLNMYQYQVLVVSLIIFGLFWFIWLNSEIGASRFAGAKLAAISGESRKMVLADIIYKIILALCQVGFCMSAAWAAVVFGTRGW